MIVRKFLPKKIWDSVPTSFSVFLRDGVVAEIGQKCGFYTQNQSNQEIEIFRAPTTVFAISLSINFRFS